MSDDAEHIYSLRDEFDRDAQKYQRAAEQALPSSLTHDSGAFEVSLDEEGMLWVEVRDTWRSVLDGERLGSEIVQLFQELAVRRATAWAENVDAASEESYRATAIPRLDDSFAAKIERSIAEDPDSGAAMTRVLTNVLHMLDDVSKNLDESFDTAFARGRAPVASPPAQFRTVEVEMTAGGDLIGVTLDPDWLQTVSATTLTRDLNSALSDVRHVAVETDSPLAGTPLEKYQELADDPEGLLRYLTGKD